MDVLDEYEACTDPAFFDCGAVELAQKLLGKYLYCHQSEILVRIIETEAYPAGDQVYRKLLGPVSASFPRKAGQILQLSAPPIDRLAPPEPRPPKVYHDSIFGVLYITATLATDQNSRDLVLLRSCEPHAQGVTSYLGKIERRLRFHELTIAHSRKNLMIGAKVVGMALAGDWESNPVLYEEGGAQLHRKKIGPEDAAMQSEAMLHAPRCLEYKPKSYPDAASPESSKVQAPESLGVDDKLRFALDTEMQYNYALWKNLEKMT